MTTTAHPDDRAFEPLSTVTPMDQVILDATDDEDVRSLLRRDAHRMMNAVGGRPSDAARSSVAAWRSGHLTEESYAKVAESYAR